MKILWVARVAAFIVLAAGLFAFIVKSLWNWLAPAVFGGHTITFWQALGILVLSKVLFGGFGPRHGPPAFWRRRMHERWARMSPEERDRFRRGLRERCGRPESDFEGLRHPTRV